MISLQKNAYYCDSAQKLIASCTYKVMTPKDILKGLLQLSASRLKFNSHFKEQQFSNDTKMTFLNQFLGDIYHFRLMEYAVHEEITAVTADVARSSAPLLASQAG